MVDAMFIFILFFLSRLTFVQFGFHSVVSSYAWFILFYCVTSLGSTHFSIMFIPHCKYFFLSSCTRNMAHSHNAVNTRSQSLLHRKYTCTRPVRQMPFGVKRLKIEEKNLQTVSPARFELYVLLLGPVVWRRFCRIVQREYRFDVTDKYSTNRFAVQPNRQTGPGVPRASICHLRQREKHALRRKADVTLTTPRVNEVE